MILFNDVAGKRNLQFKNIITGEIARQNRKTKIWTDNLICFAVPCLVCGQQIYINEQNSQNWFLHTTYTKARRLAVSNFDSLQNQVTKPFLKTTPILTENFMHPIPSPPIIKKTLLIPGILRNFECLYDTTTGVLLDSEKQRVLDEISKLAHPYNLLYEREDDLFNLEFITTIISEEVWSSAIGKNVETFAEAVYVALCLSWQWAEEDNLAEGNFSREDTIALNAGRLIIKQLAPVQFESSVTDGFVEVEPRITNEGAYTSGSGHQGYSDDPLPEKQEAEPNVMIVGTGINLKEQKAAIREERLLIALENKNRLEEKRLARIDKDAYGVVRQKVNEFLKDYSSIEINGVEYSESEIKLAFKIIKAVIYD